jgi:16S rRNA (cytidine1402-2'-O)-methyltransferase
LFDRYHIHPKKIVPYHSHNIDRMTSALVSQMLDGASVALISDAGSPGISDPGAALVADAVAAGIVVSPIAGAAAPIVAVSASGFPSHRFIYEGFLPIKKGRKKTMESWVEESRTVIFFESPKRVIKTLGEVGAIVGDQRYVCVARELSKIYEEFIRGTLGTVAADLQSRPSVKGEITVVLAPAKYSFRSANK